MSFRWILLAFLLLLNWFAYAALRRAVGVWVRRESRRRWTLVGTKIGIGLLNLPLLVFFIRELNQVLVAFPAPVLKVAFYPAGAWLATLLAFFFIVGPPTALWKLAASTRRVFGRNRP